MRRGRDSRKWNNAGFTLAELLITIAIIAILGAVVTVAAFSMIRNARQAASDKVAESLYTAVTNHLQEVWAFDYGEVATLQNNGEHAVGVSEPSILCVKKDRGTLSPGATANLMDVVLGKEGRSVSAEYYQDSIIVEYNPTSLQVYSVFYSSEVSPDQYYKSEGSAENTLEDLRYDVTKRKSEFNGYLGYYQSVTQDLPELLENEYAVTVGLASAYGDELRHLRNLDELTAPISVHIPSSEEDNIETLKFEITVTGMDSKASATLTYDEADSLNGGILKNYRMDMLRESNEYEDSKMVSFELVLDNLKEGNFKELFGTDSPTDKTTSIRFFGKTKDGEKDPIVLERKVPVTLAANEEGGLFLPGENIEVKVSAVYAGGVLKDLSDQSKNLAVDNSLFAYGSGEKDGEPKEYSAYLAYGRHLQNLSKEVSGINTGTFADRPMKAYQVKTIDFTAAHPDYEADHRYLWADLYSDKSKTIPYEAARPFLPIDNSDIVGLYGDFELTYSDATKALNAVSLKSADYAGPTSYTINGMVIRSASGKTITDAGMFKGFSGGEIKNISLTNPRISGEGVTGGFIAKAALKTGKTLLMENCALYMTEDYYSPYEINPFGISEKDGDSDIRDDADAVGVWMSGKTYAGGLIGQVSADTTDTGAGAKPTLILKNSHASTVIDTGDSGISGGLIGFVGTESSVKDVFVSMESCYADSYIYGADTGGLIGRIDSGNKVDMKYVYTAGFQEGENQAGFANGTIDKAESSYAFTQMNVKDGNAYTTSLKITSTDKKVYYFPLKSTNSGNAGKIENAEGTISVEDLAAQDQTKSVTELLLASFGASFEEDPGDTGPYNLREGMALTTYTKPRLKSLVHYGDWDEDFMPGALCYYEKYVKAGSKVRFYGGNYNALYDSLKDGVAVQADGYGLVYRKNEKNGVKPDSAEIRCFFPGTGTEGVTTTIDLTAAVPLEAEYKDETFLIYPLDKTVVNHVLNTKAENFYSKVEITYKKSGDNDSMEMFYFNPHFARAVGYLGKKGGTVSGNGGNGNTETVPELKKNGVIYVRSARHLYNMSLYYKFYQACTKGRTYRQTYDLSYKDYDWHGYFNDSVPEQSVIYRQNPIAMNADESFTATYNGGCFKIRDVSFVLEQDKDTAAIRYYTGLFGYNEGELKNIVLFADYDETEAKPAPGTAVSDSGNKHYYAPSKDQIHYYTGTDKDIRKSSELYLGMLAGRNVGTISNCATAGYYLADANGTLIGNSNGYIYAGGLVGENAAVGTIRNTSADTPFMRLTTNYARAYIGGFVGKNAGKIAEAYSHGHIEVVNPRGGAITLGGFSAINSGEIATSYAAVHMQTAGNTTVYAFSPNTGFIHNNCEYLYKGAYSYAGHLYSYNYTGDDEDAGGNYVEGDENSAGFARTRDQLIAEVSNTDRVKEGITEDYPAYMIEYKDDLNYPYRAVVTNKNGDNIHYGDWQRKPNLGEFGIFYWEKEEGTGNAGYHFSYIGVGGGKDTAGSSLCNAHDDDGVIVDYGYGYYEKKEEAGQHLIDRGQRGEETFADRGLFIPEASLDDVALKLQEQAPEFIFYPYRTLKCHNGDTQNSIYLNYEKSKVMEDKTGKNTRNGKLILRKGDAAWTFHVAPFFANAMSVDPGSASAESLIITAQDGINKTDYVKTPGTADNPYEIRTVEQLQYINWNAANQNVTTMVTDDATQLGEGIYKAFPYLAYASVTGQGKQERKDAGHNEALEFLQTHDASGLDKNGNPVIENYTPIAASQNASTLDAYDAVLYTWFGSNYDGQSYKITNIKISSPALSVGVFGVTVSARLNNIILYSDSEKGNVIERNNGSDMTLGGYSIGGLVGIAYKYGEVNGVVENCAVAGYRIIDNSTNQQTQGESNVGGLIGATRVDVKNCSAVTDIEINCTHEHDTSKKYSGHSRWGDYVRVGGLVGALPGTATNCYSGGSIKVGDETLAESRDPSGNPIPMDAEEGKICEREYSVNVYIGGMVGSAFSMNYMNFTGRKGSDDNNITLTNCYSYVEFPELTGSIRSITMMASQADRYGNDNTSSRKVFLTNCYYMNPVRGEEADAEANTGEETKPKPVVNVEHAAKYKIRSDKSNSRVGGMSPYDALTASGNFKYNDGNESDESFYNNMIRGGGAYCSYVTGYKNERIKSPNPIDQDVHLTELKYNQLSGEEGGIKVWDNSAHNWKTQGEGKIMDYLSAHGFKWVTTTLPSGAGIDGKYSFPGNDKTMDGLNYPFPTIVTQKDLVFNRTVNVHYGRWPLAGMYWSEARSEVDIFGDQADDGWAYKELEILDTRTTPIDKDSFYMETTGIVEVVSVEPETVEKEGKLVNGYKVKFKAKKPGTETIHVGSIDGPAVVLEVKANFSVTTDPTKLILPSVSGTGDVDAATKDLTLKAEAVSTPDPVSGATTTKDFSTRAKWNIKMRDNGIAYINKTAGAYDVTFGPGTASCQITGENSGKTRIIVTATLNYNGTDYDSSVYVPLQTYGVVGLSNNALDSAGTDGVFWNETSRAADGSHDGANRTYTSLAPNMSDDGKTDLYLYESYPDEALGNAKITGISINGEAAVGVSDGTVTAYTAGGYVIDIGTVASNLSTDGKFRYRSLKLRPVERSAGGEATVQITLKDGETEATYTLTGVVKRATHVVTADANLPAAGGSPEMPWKSLHADTNGNVDLSGDANMPTLTGYQFTGWATSADGDAVYCTGADHSVNAGISGLTADTTLFAKWVPITYTIAFDPGYGNLKNPPDNLAPLKNIAYDQNVTLYGKADVAGDTGKYNPPDTSPNFVGWNTKREGDGISFKPGAEANNLTAVNDETVTLYAQWRDNYKLTFIDYKTGEPSKLEKLLSAGESSYQIVKEEAGPVGVDAPSTRNGKLGYYWTSGSGTTYRFVGWDTSRRKPEADVALKISFDAGGNPTFPTITGIEGDMTFYAIWTEAVTCSLTLEDHLDGSVQSYSEVDGNLKSLSEIAGYTKPNHPGYDFVGWYSKRISEGGEKYVSIDSLLKDGKALAELTDATGSLTLHARYEETIYTRITKKEDLTSGDSYLITVAENGNESTFGNAKGKFAYLLTDEAGGDLVGADHVFCKYDGEFYASETGEGNLGTGDYMDAMSMPELEDKHRNIIIPKEIPANAIWTWNNGNIYLEGSESTGDKRLSVNSGGKLVVGSVAGIWGVSDYKINPSEYRPDGYFGVSSVNENGKTYWVHTNYNLFNAGTSENDKNSRVNFYKKTEVFFDVKPPDTTTQ